MLCGENVSPEIWKKNLFGQFIRSLIKLKIYRVYLQLNNFNDHELDNWQYSDSESDLWVPTEAPDCLIVPGQGWDLPDTATRRPGHIQQGFGSKPVNTSHDSHPGKTDG